MQKILLMEDDAALGQGICLALKDSSVQIRLCQTLAQGRRALENGSFALLILDVNLPDGNGFDLCKKIKEAYAELPVIFLTAKDLEADVLAGYDLGAEDYITKPFRMPILLKRVEVALRRSGGISDKQSGGDCYRDDFLEIDFGAFSAWRDGEKLSVTPNEYKLLRVLTANAGNVVTRRLLLEKLWDCDENFIDDHTLTVTMNRLRAKIEDEKHSYIKTVRGMGYIWENRV